MTQLHSLDNQDVQNPQQRHLVDVYNFLRTTTWKPVVEGANGTSWIEMLARFQCLGGNTSPAIQAPSGVERLLSLRQHLQTFTNTTKRLVASHVQPGDRLLFAPARNKQCRLHAYGIVDHVLCISAEMCLSSDDAKQLHIALASLCGKLNRGALQQLTSGNLVLTLQKIRLKKPIPWPETSVTKLRELCVKLRGATAPGGHRDHRDDMPAMLANLPV